MRKKYRVKRHAVTQPSDPSYKIIPLTKGQNAIVDAVDYDFLNRWNWCAIRFKTSRSFYAKRGLHSGESILMHRVILGCKPGEEGDHWNHNTLDNRRENLRKCTHEENQRNMKMRKDNTSGFKGIVWDKRTGKWAVRVGFKSAKNGYKWVGRFSSRQEAARAYDEAAKKYHKQFAHLNFPPPS